MRRSDMPIFRHSLSLAALALALAGCVVTVPGGRPDLAVPADWTRGPEAGDAAARPARWWEAFGVEELHELIAQAQAANPELEAAGRRIARAAAQIRAAGAGLSPDVSGSANLSRSWRGDGRQTNVEHFRGILEASYEIDAWGRTRFGIESAEATRLAREFEREALALSLSAEVATAYFQYLSLGDRIARSQRIVDTAERVLGLVEQQVAVGLASPLELAQQRAAVASLRANIPSLERQRAETLNALAVLLGRPPGAVSLRRETLEGVDVPAVAPGLPSALLERRPDLRQAEAELRAARADLGAARAAMLPSIRLTGSTGFGSAQLADLFSPAGFLASLASGLTAPVFDAGRLSSLAEAAEAREAELIATYRSAVLAAFQDVEDALAAIELLAEAEAAQRIAAEQAQIAFDLAQARYESGIVDFLTVLQTQRDLFQAEDALQQTRLARMNAVVSLYRALGGGWD